MENCDPKYFCYMLSKKQKDNWHLDLEDMSLNIDSTAYDCNLRQDP